VLYLVRQAIYTEGVPEGVDCEECEDEHYCSDECRKVLADITSLVQPQHC
jgi:hypothetical protein